MAVLRRSISKPRPPLEYDPARAARDAHRIAQNFTLRTIPLDVEGLAAALGLRVLRLPLEERVSGFLRESAGIWEIGVNSLHHPNRQRFTLAHELGHYLLHRDHAPFEDGLLFRSDAKNAREREANQFAALVLMPDTEFRTALSSGDIDSVARTFGVSKQAAEYRRDSVINSIGID
ncbi:ImmA/IrrE family metallo-endopeptidase [Chelativorans petroleitrophicus]|uniref:ImmA/IrrE family metallo-endopeptidase n=1 Tax=Chelativorans petroleitrophicus TaxID=2975484 RepID=UPI0021C1C967|nr:ImmA/IrrE family metallo-endopeptidase [Chelativorans petroleitrophicus]